MRTSPASPAYPQDEQFAYEVELTTGAQPVHIGMIWESAPWPGGWEFEGTPLEFRTPALSGPGTMLEPRGFIVNFQLAYGITAACIRGEARNRTYDADGRELHLQANSSATLRVPAVLTSGPWPSVSYSPNFFIFRINAQGEPVTYDSVRLAAPDVDIGGTSGVYIRVKAQGKRGGFGRQRKSPRLNGTTNPPLVDELIQLKAIKLPRNPIRQIGINVSLSDWGSKRARNLGSVMTDDEGRFHLRRRRMAPGTYRVLARYEGGQSGVTRDWNCGPLFRTARR